ncbi:MAG: GGDEF domain-containing protein [Acidithiobacillus sp.]
MIARPQSEFSPEPSNAALPVDGVYLDDLIHFYDAWKIFWQLWLRAHLQGDVLPRQAEQQVLQALHMPESRIPPQHRTFWQHLQERYHDILQQLQKQNPGKEHCPAPELLPIMEAAALLERQCFDEIIAFSKNLGEIDPLTGLPNRRRMEQDLIREQSLIDRGGTAFVAMLDVDHFKGFNDRFGHIVGDEVLKELSRRLRFQLRHYDGLYRYGGEEFLIIFPRMHRECGLITAQRLCQKIAAEPFQVTTGESVTISVSIGITPLIPHISPSERIIIADAALYQAKHEGRNQARLLP